MLTSHDDSVVREYVRRTIRGVVVLALAVLLLWFAADVLLLAFAAVLLAVFLCALTDWVTSHAHIGRGFAYALVVLGLGALLTLAVWKLAPPVAAQVNELIADLPRSLERTRRFLGTTYWGRALLAQVSNTLAGSQLLAGSGRLASNAFEVVASVIVVVVAGLYFAASPGTYRRGIELLVPGEYRARAHEVLGAVGNTLKWWVLAQTIPMAILGTVTGVALWAIGVPLAFTLGVLTGVIIFIPYAGSLISGAVVAAVALTNGPAKMLAAVLLYTAVHVAEGYLITPLVQKRAVLLPPGLTILAQLFMGVTMGFLGLALATPLAAAVMAVVKMTWVGMKPEPGGNAS